MNTKPKSKSQPRITNKKAYHDYHIDQEYQAGLVLEGWEVKAIREGRVQLKDSHITVKDNELWLVAAHISPLSTTAKISNPDPMKRRKLLLARKEISKIIGTVQQKGHTIVPLNFHFKKGTIKCQMALARGKKTYDKRKDARDKDWSRQKDRIMKTSLNK